MDVSFPLFPDAVLTEITGVVEHLSPDDGLPWTFDGHLDMGIGPTVGIAWDVWTGGSVEAPLIVVEGDAHADSERLTVDGTMSALWGILAQAEASVRVNFSAQSLYADLTARAFLGALTGSAVLYAWSDLAFMLRCTGSGNFPDPIPVLGGHPIVSASLVAQYTPSPRGGFVAAWGTVSFPLVGGGVALGVRVSLADGSWEFIGPGAIAQLVGGAGAAGMTLAGAPSQGWDVPSGIEWAAFTADWENQTPGVAIQLTGPDSTVYDEAAIAANPDMAIVDDLSGLTRRTVQVRNPAAGAWTLTVVDDTGLGATTFTALQAPSDPPTVSVDLAQDTTAQGGSATVPYTANDADSQASVLFYYDTDGAGYDGLLMGDGVAESDASDNYVWDTSGVAPGTYHVYAMILDESGLPVFSGYAAGRVIVPENPPTTADDPFTVLEDSANNLLDVLGNDSAAPDAAQRVVVTGVTAPGHGTATVGDGGTHVLYTPAADFQGTDTFTYTIADDGGQTDTATVTITVTGQADPPAPLDDQADVPGGASKHAIAVLDNDSPGPLGTGTLRVCGVGEAAHGQAAVSPDALGVRYTPEPGFWGTDSFTYMVVNADGATGIATVTVEVPPGPDLTVTQPSAAALEVYAGQAMDLDAAVVNEGLENAGAFTVGLYLSADPIVTTGDTLLASYSRQGLPIGDSYTENLSFNAPAGAGTYYVAAIADSAGAVAELDETNNVGPVVTLTVAAGTLVAFGDGAARSVRVVDGAKTITVTLVGGAGSLLAAGDDELTVENKPGQTVVTGAGAEILTVTLDVSTLRTLLIFSVAGGNAVADVGSIQARGAVGTIMGMMVNVGELVTDGPARMVMLRDIVNGRVDIGAAGAAATDKTILTLGSLQDTSVNLGVPGLSFTVADWLDTDGTPDTLTAPGITILRTTGRPAIATRGQAKSAGHFQADLNLGAAQTPGGGLGSFMVAGTWDQSQATIFGQGAGGNSVNFVSAGQVANASLTASGGVGTILAGSWQAGNVQATTVGSAVIRGNAGLNMTLSGQNRAGNSLTAFTALGDVTGTVLNLAGGAGVVNVRSWTGGAIQALYIGSLLTTRGAFGADLTLTGQNAAGNSLNVLSAALGAVNSATIALAGAAGTIIARDWAAGQFTGASVGVFMSRGDFTGNLTLTGQNAIGRSLNVFQVLGEMNLAVVRARGGVGSALIGSLRHSALYVSVLDGVAGMPAPATTAEEYFAALPAGLRGPAIGTFMITRPAGVFENSVVAGPSMGTVLLRGVAVDNGLDPFGLVGDTKINMLIRYRDGAAPSIGRNLDAGLVDTLPAEADFQVAVL